MQFAKRRVKRIRAIELVLKGENLSEIERRFVQLYNFVRIKKKFRSTENTVVQYAINVINCDDNPSCSIYVELALALREVDKKKTSPDAHRLKCYTVHKHLINAKAKLPSATRSEKKCYRFTKALVEAIMANQIIPGDY